MRIRAAAHVHSDWSHDGRWPLSTIVRGFRRAGFHCVLTSEHDVSFTEQRWRSYRQACIASSTDNFLIVPGIEYSDPLNVVHVLVWGDIPFLGVGRDTEELLHQVKECHGVAVLAHPSRRDAWQAYQSHWAPLLLGMEQWNRKVDGVAPSREGMDLLAQKAELSPFVGLDFHRANQFFPLYMALHIDGRLSEERVLAELLGKRAKARLGGVSIDWFSKGALYDAAQGMEHLRRHVRRIVKREKKRTG
jgi:hypothetical protein